MNLSKFKVGVALVATLIICTSIAFAIDDSSKPINNIDVYQSTLKDLDNKIPRDLSHSKSLLKNSHVKDALRLWKTKKLIKTRPEEAKKQFIKIRSTSPLYNYGRYYLAKTYSQLRKYSTALRALPVISSPSKKIEWDTVWFRMKLLALTKQKDQILKETALLKKKYRRDKWVPIKSNYYLGLSEYFAKNKKSAYVYFRKVVVDQPGTEYDNKIFDLLKIKRVSPNKLLSTGLWNKRAEKLVSTGFPLKALNTWQALYQNNPAYQEKVAYGHFKARRYKKAAELYKRLLESGNFTASQDSLWDKIAHSYLRYDNFEQATIAFKHIINNFPNSKYARRAKFKLGFIHFDSENYEQASSYFALFLKKGSSWQRDRAHWFRFWSFYLLQKYDQALIEIDTITKKYKSKRQSLTYWKARIFDKTGKEDQARAIYNNLVAKNPLGYYGLLSKHRLRHPFLSPSSVISSDVLSHLPKKNTKTKRRFKKFKKVTLDKGLTTAVLLSKIGLFNESFDESRYSSLARGSLNYEGIKAFEMAKNFNRGFGLRKQNTRGQTEGASLLEGFRFAYPRAYREFVSPFSHLWKIEPNLVYAMMRQESAFKPEALSYAFAYGLMQIIPPTAQEIANKIKFPNFQTHLLNKPDVNIFFGTYYIKYLLDTFDNNLIFTIAGYNAGPDAVSRWSKKANTMEMDEFIELIPYMETSDYVKKVLVNYLVYERLY